LKQKSREKKKVVLDNKNEICYNKGRKVGKEREEST
jgi:hypothetical protein